MIYERAMLLASELRSGKYKQGHDRLTTIREDGWEYDCCLGVACKVAIRYGVSLQMQGTLITLASESSERCIMYNGVERTTLTDIPEVRNFFDFKSSSGLIKEALPNRDSDEGYRSDIELTDLNDSNFTFDQIADVITYFWKEL